MASSSFKANPFDKSNPFQVHRSFQPSTSSSSNNLMHQVSYRQNEYQPITFALKQNSFLKHNKPENQMWKFREDNCNKNKIFNHNNQVILNEKYLQDKNSFQKQLVLSNVAKRSNQSNHNQNYQKQIGNQRIQNPFNRKYLVNGGKLAESHVYVPASSMGEKSYQLETKTYQRTINEFGNNKYNNYVYTGEVQRGEESHGLAYSLNRNQYQNYSSKSIDVDQNSFNLNPIQSRYSLQKQKAYNEQGSFRNMYPPSSNQNIAYGNSKVSVNSRNSRGSRASRGSRTSQQQNKQKLKDNQRMRFSQSDDQKQQHNQKQPQSNVPSKQVIQKPFIQMAGPATILINGKQFYKQKIQSL